MNEWMNEEEEVQCNEIRSNNKKGQIQQKKKEREKTDAECHRFYLFNFLFIYLFFLPSFSIYLRAVKYGPAFVWFNSVKFLVEIDFNSVKWAFDFEWGRENAFKWSKFR